MTTYRGLGARGPQVGAADTTGLNTGNWTIAFTPDSFNINVPQFEVYKIVVKGAPGTSFTVYVDLYQWDQSIYGASNSWDPVQPLILLPGQTLYFLYSDPVTDDNPPVATVWLRYDVDFHF